MMDAGLGIQLTAVVASFVAVLSSVFTMLRARKETSSFAVKTGELSVLCKGMTSTLSSEQKRHLAQLADTSPEATVLAAWHEFEKAHAEYVFGHRNRAVSDVELRRAIDELCQLRSQLTHAAPVQMSKELALQFAEIANTVAAQLRAAAA